MDRKEGRKKLLYHYYQTPDGEEFGQKLWFLLKPAIEGGLALGASDVMVITKPVGWLPLIERFLRISVRPMVTAILFESSVYAATKLRKKDDGWNHVIGGAVCGYYWSRFIGYYPISIPLTILACAALYNFKTQKMLGIQLFYDEYDIDSDLDHGAWTRFNTWSLRKQYPKTWLTSEEAAAQGIQP